MRPAELLPMDFSLAPSHCCRLSEEHAEWLLVLLHKSHKLNGEDFYELFT